MMRQHDEARWRFWMPAFAMAAAVCWPFSGKALGAEIPSRWIALFDGRSLDGWRASEHADAWRVEDGCLVAGGPRSRLFYQGPVGDHRFGNFELEAELRTEPGCDSGIFFYTQYRPHGAPAHGYELQINNTHSSAPERLAPSRTGSLNGVRNLYSSCVGDGRWFRVRLRAIGSRIAIWVNDRPTVDYLRPNPRSGKLERAGGVPARGTIALQGPDAGSRVAFRRVAIRLLADDADPGLAERASTVGYGLEPAAMDRLARHGVPVIDFHVHLRGGMTVEKAMDRQAVTGINVGVLRNLGKGWPIETDDQLRAFLDGVAGRPVFVGLQVNDRDWADRHARDLLGRLDFVLGDTMIMPMPDDQGPPVKLWLADRYTIEDAEAWMERYVRHNLRVLSEPITILANPTYLPPALEDRYDALWTEARMRQVIQAAVDHRVALEINARSGLPHERFIRLAKKMGARFAFGSNNFDDRPIDMSRCIEAIDRYGLTPDELYVPVRRR